MLAGENAVHLEQLRKEGVVLLQGCFPQAALAVLREAAQACFAEAEKGSWRSFPEHYQFSPISFSVRIDALQDFGITHRDELVAPLEVDGLDRLLASGLGGRQNCDLRQAWVRKRYAPCRAPARYYPNTWHQDGGLGVRFPESAETPVAMTRLLTCWLPLDCCDEHAPRLELVRRPLNGLLHYSELGDASLRGRFAPEDFWAPCLEPGDGLVLLDGTLHRTYLRPEMNRDRLSVEYRFFPSGV